MIHRVTLQASNGMYVCADGTTIVANRPQAQAWETFVLTTPDTRLHTGSSVNFTAHTGKFVCAENGGAHPLVANRDAAAGWETFSIEKAGGGDINSGDSVFLKACNGKYVCAEGGGGRELIANRDVPQGWETFKLMALPVFPVKMHADDELASGAWMESWATLYETGLLHLEVWSHANSAEGHHGSSSVVLLDQNRQLLFRSDPLNLGIAGKWDWTGQSDRNGTMEFHVPPEILREVVYGGVVQRNLGGSDLLAWLVSSEGAQTIGSIVQVIALLA